VLTVVEVSTRAYPENQVELDLDWRIRLAAIETVRKLAENNSGVVTAAELSQGFVFDGERISLWDERRGIWRPRQLRDQGAALTIRTAPRIEGRQPMYDDEVADSDRPWFRYKYQGTNPDEWTNVAVRTAMQLQRPLIYLYGISKGVYDPIAPVFVVGDDPQTLTFNIQGDQLAHIAQSVESSLVDMTPARRA
jgi:putative restriction endonuclease